MSILYRVIHWTLKLLAPKLASRQFNVNRFFIKILESLTASDKEAAGTQ